MNTCAAHGLFVCEPCGHSLTEQLAAGRPEPGARPVATMEECRRTLTALREHHGPVDRATIIACLECLLTPRQLTKPARIGNSTFCAGVYERMVVERAQREYEYLEAIEKDQGDHLVSITHNGSTHCRKASEWLALARADLKSGAGLI